MSLDLITVRKAIPLGIIGRTKVLTRIRVPAHWREMPDGTKVRVNAHWRETMVAPFGVKKGSTAERTLYTVNTRAGQATMKVHQADYISGPRRSVNWYRPDGYDAAAASNPRIAAGVMTDLKRGLLAALDHDLRKHKPYAYSFLGATRTHDKIYKRLDEWFKLRGYERDPAFADIVHIYVRKDPPR